MERVSKPAYVTMDEKNRESFLSQIGSFLSSERVIFHTLCQMWEPRIPYQNVTAAVSKISMSGLSDFKQLMDKLRTKGIGLIRTTVENRAQIPDSVVLCDEWSSVFFHETIGEWMTETRIFSKHPLPTASAMKKQNLIVPPQLLTKASLIRALQLYESIKAEESPATKILQIQISANDSLYIGADQFGLLLNIIILKLRNEFRNTDALSKLARQTNKSIIEIKQQFDSKETSFWSWVISAILSNAEEWAKRDPEIVYCAHFLKQYLEARSLNRQEQEQQELAKEEHYRAIIDSVCTEPDLVVSMVDLETSIQAYKEIYDKKFVQFREEFLTRFLKPITSNELSLLLGFTDKVLHRDNVCKYFLTRFYELSGNLRRTCIKSLAIQLRGNTNSGSEFKSPHHFERFVRDLVHDTELFVYALLERPVLLGEIVAHHFKNMRKSKPKEFEQLLKRFFNTEEMKIRPYVKIFELNIENIFAASFAKLPFLKKIWMRINGQYSTLLSEFQWSNMNEEIFTIDAPETEEDSPISSKQLQKLRLSKIIAGENTSDSASAKGATLRRRKTETDSVAEVEHKNQKSLTDQQLDDLWGDFKQVVKNPKQS